MGYQAVVAYDRVNGQMKHRQILASDKAIVDSDLLLTETSDLSKEKIDEAFDFYGHKDSSKVVFKKLVQIPAS